MGTAPGFGYCQQWPRGTRSRDSELVARPVPKPERRSVGVTFFCELHALRGYQKLGAHFDQRGVTCPPADRSPARYIFELNGGSAERPACLQLENWHDPADPRSVASV